jgi:Ni/Co efflux regulator RcnB
MRHRRDNPSIQIYRGPEGYRTGQRPPQSVQRRFNNRNFDQYRHEYRAERRFRVRPYVRPRGWYSFAWGLGDILPNLFWSENYWIVDYWRYGLPVPPYNCVWVRNDSDALLIDRGTGEVVEVIYDVFY